MKTYVIRISERHNKYLKDKAALISKKAGFRITPRATLEAIIEDDMPECIKRKCPKCDK